MPKKPTVAEASREYIQLKADLKRMQARLEELDEIIKPALAEAEDQSLLLHGHRFKLVHREAGERFDLKAAKEKIDGRTLAPYISQGKPSEFILLTWQGGEDRAGV